MSAAKFGLPSMTVAGVAFHPEQGSVDLVFGTGSGARVVPLAVEVLGALLVYLCMTERVPLPRGAAKSVQMGPSAVILKFTMAITKRRRPPALPPVWRSTGPVDELGDTRRDLMSCWNAIVSSVPQYTAEGSAAL